MGNGGMFTYDQLGLAIRLMCKMRRVSERESRDPVATPDQRVCSQMQKLEALANGEMTYARSLFHDELFRSNPRQTNPAAGVNAVTELLLEKLAPPTPRQQKTNENEKRVHSCGERLR